MAILVLPFYFGILTLTVWTIKRWALLLCRCSAPCPAGPRYNQGWKMPSWLQSYCLITWGQQLIHHHVVVLLCLYFACSYQQVTNFLRWVIWDDLSINPVAELISSSFLLCIFPAKYVALKAGWWTWKFSVWLEKQNSFRHSHGQYGN